MELMRPGADGADALEKQIQVRRAAIETGTRAGNLSADARMAGEKLSNMFRFCEEAHRADHQPLRLRGLLCP